MEGLFNQCSEDCVIAGLVSSNNQELIDNIFRTVEPEHFYSMWHRDAFVVCKQIYASGEGIDFITVSDRIKDPARLTAVLKNGTTNTLTHAKNVKELAMRRCIAEAGTSLVEMSKNKATPIDDIMGEASARIFTTHDVTGKQTVKSGLDLVKEFLPALRERVKGDKTGIEMKSGFQDIDMFMGGWHASHLNILAARPAMGKTALALNIIKKTAVDYKIPSVFFSMEMANGELMQRMASIVSKVDNQKIKKGALTPNEIQAIISGTQRVSDAPIYVEDIVQKFSSLCVTVRSLVRRYGVKIVVMDYLQLIKPSNNKRVGTREQDLTEIAQGLKELAKETKTCIISLAQLNRGLEAREDKRPVLSDLRESGGLEQAADNVFMLYRPCVYYDDANINEAQLITRKQRDGELFTSMLHFKGEHYGFYDTEQPR